MGNDHGRQKDTNSNSSVLDMPLDQNNIIEENTDQAYDYNIINNLKKTIKLPIENEEEEEFEEIVFDDKEDEIKKNFFLDNDIFLNSSDLYHVHRSKSCVNNKNISLFNAPKPQLKIFNEHLSPLQLSTKNFGGSQRSSKKPNPIILDFQKGIMDNKSCNDNQNFGEELLEGFTLDTETESSTPNVEDLQNLNNCRKKMQNFRDSIDNKSEHSLDENDKIEDIFSEKNESDIKQKKNNFWMKHIKQQKLMSKLSNNLRISISDFLRKSETVRNPILKNSFKDIDNNLYILGILESAAKEKKEKLKKLYRYTSNV